MNILKNNNIWIGIKTIPKVFSLLRKCDKTYLVVMLLEVLAFSIEKYPALLIMKYTIDALTQGTDYTTYLRNIILMILIMLMVKMFKVYINTTRPTRDQIVTEKLFNAFFAQCMKISYQILESKEMQDKKELAKYIANGKIAAVGWYFVEMFSSLIALVIATVLLFQISPLILIVLVLGLSVKALISKKILDKRLPISKKQVIDKRFLNYLYSIGSEFEYVKDFRVFRYKENLFKKIDTAKEDYLDSNRKVQKINFWQSVMYSAEDFCIKLSSFFIMGYYCLKSVVSLSDFTFVIGLVNDYISYTDALMSSCTNYIDATKYIDHYFDFMSYDTPPVSAIAAGNRPVPSDKHIIELNNVSFKYLNSNEYALKNINFVIETPCKISLVGANGAGKSTLIKLLLRLYKPTEGSITLDGKNIHEYSDEEYMSFVSSIFQDFVLFAFTVEENITSFTCADSKYLTQIAIETGVEEFIRQRPNKLKSYISNAYSSEGIDFSGGEKQKIALARAVYKKSASLYILDEPTATYDADAEYKLYQKYEELLSGKTSIFISHRLSSCRLSDRVILLQNASVVEDGSHNELMKQGGLYKHMFELQANQYQKEGKL